MNQGPEKKKRDISSLIAMICLVTSLVLAVGGGVFAVLWFTADRSPPEPIQVEIAPPPSPAPIPPPAPKQEPEPEPEIETEPIREYPVGRFGPDELRREYISGEMTLRVPRMDYDGPVFSSEQDITQGTPTYQGVSDNVLDRGPGLFGAAQLPGLGNANVSIAAHRDIVGREFWDIDKMQEGDYIYLTFRGREYVYLFEDSFVTHDKDWDPVRVKEYGVVTLQSCHPIFIASHRMFVVGRLVAVIDDEDSIIFGEYDEYEMDAAA